MATDVRRPRLSISPSRRAFLRLAAVGASGAAALRFGLLSGRGTDGGDGLLLAPVYPQREGPFGESQLRQWAAALMPERAAFYLDPGNCWAQVAGDIYAMSLDQRRAALDSFFANFLHGADYAEFIYWLSQIDFSKSASAAPSADEVQPLAGWLNTWTKGSSGIRNRTEEPAVVRVRNAGDTLADLNPLSLMLQWEDAVAMPKTGPEFQYPDALIAGQAVAVYAFGRAAMQLGRIAQRERQRGAQPGATIAGAAVELVMGGIQAIADQDTFGVRPQAALLARLAASGHLLVGTSVAGRLVFARIQNLAGGQS